MFYMYICIHIYIYIALHIYIIIYIYVSICFYMCIIYVVISHLNAAQEKLASRANLEVDVFKVSTEHNDRAILEGTTRGDLDGCVSCDILCIVL